MSQSIGMCAMEPGRLITIEQECDGGDEISRFFLIASQLSVFIPISSLVWLFSISPVKTAGLRLRLCMHCYLKPTVCCTKSKKERVRRLGPNESL